MPTCHCEPVTGVTGVAIRFPGPLAEGAVAARAVTGGVSLKRQDTPSVFCSAKSTSLKEGGKVTAYCTLSCHCEASSQTGCGNPQYPIIAKIGTDSHGQSADWSQNDSFLDRRGRRSLQKICTGKSFVKRIRFWIYRIQPNHLPAFRIPPAIHLTKKDSFLAAYRHRH